MTVTLLDNVSKHFLDFLNGEGLSQLKEFSCESNVVQCVDITYLRDIYLLDLKVIQDVRHSLQRDQLSGAYILLSL